MIKDKGKGKVEELLRDMVVRAKVKEVRVVGGIEEGRMG